MNIPNLSLNQNTVKEPEHIPADTAIRFTRTPKTSFWYVKFYTTKNVSFLKIIIYSIVCYKRLGYSKNTKIIKFP